MQALASVGRVSSYWVSVGNAKPMRVKNFRDARSIVATAMTNFLAQDPEAVASDASSVNLAFETGAIEHSLTAHRTWSTAVTVHGEPVQIAIKKRRWYLLRPVLRVVRGGLVGSRRDARPSTRLRLMAHGARL